MRGGAGDEQRVLVLPDAARRGAVVRPVVRAALHAALGLPAAALPAPRAPVAAVPQLLLTTTDYRRVCSIRTIESTLLTPPYFVSLSMT